MATTTILPGYKIGALTVVKFHHRELKGRTTMPYFECLCQCGETTIVRSDGLSPNSKRGARHCRNRKNHAKFTHNMSRTPEYRTRTRMLSRCYDKNYHGYYKHGGRGITVCERWRNSFEAFYEDMGPRPSSLHSIERIDNNGNYEPGNCKWATALEQMRNTRHNRYVTFNGETLCISEWASRMGIGHATLAKRIRRWGIEKALTTPKQSQYDHGALVRLALSNSDRVICQT